MDFQMGRAVDPFGLRRLIDDEHRSADGDLAEERLDIGRVHADTAGTHAAAYAIGLVRAVDAVQAGSEIERVVAERILRPGTDRGGQRSEEHTSELQYLMRTSYAVFCLKNKNT